jgi:hypothetical protein
MPPRIVTATIILFWLATTGALVYYEAAPRFQAGEPPPFIIDLTAEVSADDVNWIVLQKNQRIGDGSTHLRRLPDRTFEFTAKFEIRRLQGFGAEIGNMAINGRYVVSEEGALLTAEANFQCPAIQLIVDFRGNVRERRFHPRLSIQLLRADIPIALEPFPVAESGSILNPMHLVHKISGLRDGQTWSIPLMDPVRALPEAARGLVPSKDLVVDHVLAKVTSEDREWQGAMVSCFKIEYAKRDEQPLAATWVRRSDSLVLQQWASYEGIEFTLQRVQSK